MKTGLLLFSLGLIFNAGLRFKAEVKPDPRQSFDKSGYYQVIASGDLSAIDSELALLAHAMPKEKDAYEGTLQMKKAGLLHRPREKLTTFRSGVLKLETALVKDSSNGEYHFLRLIIQEHAPAVVHYNKNQEVDSRYVYKTFKTLSPVVQKAILDYSKHSKLLRAKELDG
jgi:hypothetical protein